jgi:hypothetical protein
VCPRRRPPVAPSETSPWPLGNAPPMLTNCQRDGEPGEEATWPWHSPSLPRPATHLVHEQGEIQGRADRSAIWSALQLRATASVKGCSLLLWWVLGNLGYRRSSSQVVPESQVHEGALINHWRAADDTTELGNERNPAADTRKDSMHCSNKPR